MTRSTDTVRTDPQDRYTVIYEGNPRDVRILNGEPAPGRAVGVMLGDLAEKYDAEDKRFDTEMRRLEAEAAQLRSELVEVRGERDEARKENDYLRASLANGGGPCAYCRLPREDWAKCSAGFPGCPRADDADLCQHVGSWLHAQSELIEAGHRFDRLLIAFHDAIRRPLGVTPDSGAEFYDQRMADEAEARRAVLTKDASVIGLQAEAPDPDPLPLQGSDHAER